MRDRIARWLVLAVMQSVATKGYRTRLHASIVDSLDSQGLPALARRLRFWRDRALRAEDECDRLRAIAEEVS